MSPSMRGALGRCLVALAAACALAVVAPRPALALDTAKCTAKPNGGGGSDVLGVTETRITWEGQAAPDEQLSGLSLTLPTGTTFSTDDARVTILSGKDLMNRQPVRATFSTSGQTVSASFDGGAAQAGAYVRLELYGVRFPAAGGDQRLSGSYLLADGSSHDISDIPAIAVTGVTPTEQLSHYLKVQPWVKRWESNRFLRLFFDPPIFVSSLPSVFQGFLMALAIVLVAFPLAIPLGFLLALMRVARTRVVRAVASLYVNVVRGTPAFLQIYIAFFGLPLAGMQIAPYPLGVAVLAMNSAAYLCEIFRAGIQSIPDGQTEAARSLGMSAAQTMVYVVVPQTFRNVLPTMTSEFILLYKDTSLLAAVGVMEVVMYAKTIVASTGSITPYIVAALFYLAVTLPLSHVVGRLEARLASNAGGRRKRRRVAAPAGPLPVIDGDHLA